MLPELECALYGPAVGDEPVSETTPRLVHKRRPGRAYASRLIDKPTRPTRTCTVIAGPFEGEPCVLYTVFGGPSSPKEPGDPTLEASEMEASATFWAQHALAQSS